MSPWTRHGWFEAGPKRPPPEHGIRMKKAGTTWWGLQWIEALERVLGGDAGRLARGRTYARAGRTHDLVIKGGRVTANVTGSRPWPYEITLELAQLPDSAWKQAISLMGAKAQFSAELLAGQMPQAIDELFAEVGVSLFPKKRSDFETTCTCPDWGDPCKHVAATHYVLGEALDRDPFLLFELRGRTREQVLGALRAARTGATAAAPGKSEKRRTTKADSSPEVPTVKLGKIAPGEYDQPRAPLPTLRFRFDEAVTHGAVLRQLGTPSTWAGESTPADVLSPLVRAAAETARRIALSDPNDTDEASAAVTANREEVTRARGRRGKR